MRPGQQYLSEGHLTPGDDRVQTSQGRGTLAVALDGINPAAEPGQTGIQSKQLQRKCSIRRVPEKTDIYIYVIISLLFILFFIPFVNCFGRTMLYTCIEYHI